MDLVNCTLLRPRHRALPAGQTDCRTGPGNGPGRESDIVKLASNENPLGASPRALAAIENVLMEIARYPDGNGFTLKTALAEKHGVDMNQIVLGNGSNDVLELVARAFLTPRTSAVYRQHAFAVYPLATQAVGARGIEAPAQRFRPRPRGHAGGDHASDTRAILFIANPNNPTGTLLDAGQLLGIDRTRTG